jgi:tetratricopeptide (TPR) repeat protein
MFTLWETVLLDWLDEADMAFVFWSGHAATSEWVNTEVDLLLSRAEHRLVPVRLDDTPLSEELGKRQGIDMGAVLKAWSERASGDVQYAPVRADQVGASLWSYLKGEADPGLLLTVDRFDLGCVIDEVGKEDPGTAVTELVGWRDEPRLRRELEEREETFGPNHVDVAVSLHNLAELYLYMQRFDEAEALALRALSIRERTAESQPERIVESLNFLAQIQNSQSRFDRALEYMKRAHTICVSSLGLEHRYTAIVSENCEQLRRQLKSETGRSGDNVG